MNVPGNIHIGDIHQHFHHHPGQEINPDVLENKLRSALSDGLNVITDDLDEDALPPLDVHQQDKPQREELGRKRFDGETLDDPGQLFDIYEYLMQGSRRSSDQNKKDRRKTRLVATGIAGIGKTTMAKMLCKKLKNGYRNDSVPFIFFLPLGRINYSTPKNILQFLVSFMLPDWDHSLECDKILLKRINECEDVFIFTDALDEAQIDLNVRAPVMNLYDDSNPECILKNLYSGRLLPKAKLLITTRPGAFNQLHQEYKPDVRATIYGLGKSSQTRFFRHLCETEEDFDEFRDVVQLFPDATSLCFIPMFCQLLVTFFMQNMHTARRRGRLSFTNVFEWFLNYFVRTEHFRGDQSTVEKLSKLALDMSVKNKLTFVSRDVNNAGFDQKMFEAFLKVEAQGNRYKQQKILDGDQIFYFSHLMWQEFLSALHLMMSSTLEDFNKIWHNFSKNKWETVVKFMYGLCNQEPFENLLSLYPNVNDNWKAKRKMLRDFLEDSTKTFRNETIHEYPSCIDLNEVAQFSERIGFDYSSTDFLLLKISAWVFELHNREVTATVANLLPCDILLCETLLPSDVVSLCYLLSHAHNTKPRLSLGTFEHPVDFGEDGLKKLLHLRKQQPYKIRKLHVRSQFVKAVDLTDTLHDIEEISLDYCNLSRGDINGVFEAVSRRSYPIKFLDLSGNEEVSNCKDHCTKCLPMTEMLVLSECNLDELFLETLTNAIDKLPSPMKSLDLTKNEITSEGFRQLSQCIHNMQTLVLIGCGVTGDDVDVLASGIEKRDTPMKRINLGENQIGSNGVQSLSKCIHNISSLQIFEALLSSDDIGILTSQIVKSNLSINLLDVSRNRIDSVGAEHLSQCVPNLKHLWMQKCNLNASNMQIISNEIMKRNTPMETLLLSANNLGDNGAKAISRCLQNIKTLTISKCNLSEEGVTCLRMANANIDQNPCKIFGLQLQRTHRRKP